jgi:hypothetical protein
VVLLVQLEKSVQLDQAQQVQQVLGQQVQVVQLGL